MSFTLSFQFSIFKIFSFSSPPSLHSKDSEIFTNNAIAHITLSTKEGVPDVYSNEMLEKVFLEKGEKKFASPTQVEFLPQQEDLVLDTSVCLNTFWGDSSFECADEFTCGFCRFMSLGT